MAARGQQLSIQSDGNPYKSKGRGSLQSSLLAVFGIAMMGAASALALGLIGNSGGKPSAMDTEYTGALDISNYVGVLVVFTLLPAGTVATLVGLYLLWRTAKSNIRAAVTYGTLLTSTAAGLFILFFSIRPQDTFSLGYGTNHYDVVKSTVGGVVLVQWLACVAAAAWILVSRATSTGDQSDANPVFAPLHTRPTRPVVAGLLLFAALFVLCCCLSPVFNYSPQSYFPAKSEYSLVDWAIGSRFQVKMYSDVVVYYSFIVSLIVLGCCAQVAVLKRFMHKRFKFPFLRFGMTVGEALVVLCFIGLATSWLVYWRWIYLRIVDETSAMRGRWGWMQIWARVIGHMAVLCMSVALFPVARDSVWERTFGISFDRAIKYHRFMGSVSYALGTVHMLLWYLKWALEGILWHNVFTLNVLIITPNVTPHYDNFTIQMMQSAWLCLTVMVVTAWFFRRSHYEWFQYLHVFGALFVIATAMHAWSSWYYLVGGLALWAFDKLHRIVRSTSQFDIVSVEYANDITKITVDNTDRRFSHAVGQYAFLNVPELSITQWHPFTISSAPSDPYVTFHIRDMGKTTWTHQLCELARGTASESKWHDDLEPTSDQLLQTDGRQSLLKSTTIGSDFLGIDMAYGRMPHFAESEHLVLVCGGIGVTPMHSTLSEIVNRIEAGESLGRLKQVDLVWVVRDKGVVANFATTLRRASDIATAKGVIGLHIFCSRRMTEAPAVAFNSVSQLDVQAAQALIRKGRPSLQQLFLQLDVGKQSTVMVCGPPALADTVSSLCFLNGASFHSEIFHF